MYCTDVCGVGYTMKMGVEVRVVVVWEVSSEYYSHKTLKNVEVRKENGALHAFQREWDNSSKTSVEHTPVL